MIRFAPSLGFLALLLVACSSSPKTDDSKKAPPATSSATTAPPSIAAGEPRPDMTRTESGLEYRDDLIGTGASPVDGRTVVVHYTGTFTDGKKFDSSYDHGHPYSFTIGRGKVIKGWDEGVSTMKVGGKRHLVIPPDLAYGPDGSDPIPPNCTLLFDVELLEVR